MKTKILIIPTLCACGCGEVIWNRNVYIHGHFAKILKKRNTGSKRSEASKLLMSIAKKGTKKKPLTEEHKNNLSKAHMGLKFSEEHIKNLSLSHIGNKGHWVGKKRPDMSKRFKGAGNPNWGLKQSIETITRRILRGKDHYNWQGGITPETRRRTRGLLWRQIADKIRLRDNNTCQVCGHIEVKIKQPVHHIIPFRESKNNEETNLVVVCNSHHIMLDAPNVNRDYWENYFMELLKKRGLLIE